MLSVRCLATWISPSFVIAQPSWRILLFRVPAGPLVVPMMALCLEAVVRKARRSASLARTSHWRAFFMDWMITCRPGSSSMCCENMSKIAGDMHQEDVFNKDSATRCLILFRCSWPMGVISVPWNIAGYTDAVMTWAFTSRGHCWRLILWRRALPSSILVWRLPSLAAPVYCICSPRSFAVWTFAGAAWPGWSVCCCCLNFSFCDRVGCPDPGLLQVNLQLCLSTDF